ncbi:PREDICTED: cytochrome c oxidase subunit 6C [Vollenhovia emeryi]|uniref:cytochrome c oxidase subunit 6C n=1 Tax=Vollenhovia emeryi TaxID=411798 RepID=UPI0005F564E4|nr:PREDICTED: cytochrome c oxidase subunit 6C [Vollenhovia emeryi]XP_011863877.1 PREDICTED: cytochrome c oxidase subunit 6C [Vollenhovia emeryi]
MPALEKPQLRNLHVTQITKSITKALVLGFVSAVMFKVFVADRRKQKYADFYKTYDAEKQLKIMNDAGLMQSFVPPQK